MPVVPCASAVPVHGDVVFDATLFKTAYPEFATVADAAVSRNFALATLQLTSTCSSRVQDANQREALLDLLTAHITALANGVNGQPPQGIVGRISQATEGSVSVAAEMEGATFSAAYYLQTKYGAQYWQATAKYRSMVYSPRPVCCDSGPGSPYWFGTGLDIGPMGNGDCGNNGGSA